MKKEMKTQKGFMQIPLLIIIVAGVLILGGGGYFGIKEYKNYQAQKLEKEKLAQEAIRTQQEKDSEQRDEIEQLRKKIEELDAKKPETIVKEIIRETEKSTPESEKVSVEELLNYGLDYLVNIICLAEEGIINASGIIIGFGNNSTGRASTYILTNNHVLSDAIWYDPDKYPLQASSFPGLGRYPCVVIDFSDPNKSELSHYAAEIYYPPSISLIDMKTIDFGFLRLTEKVKPDLTTIIQNQSLILSNGKRPNICSDDFFGFGKKLYVLGFPSIGTGITTTEGIISGIGEKSYYITTSAKIDQGDSGGPALLEESGCLVGMATFAKIGVIESLSRLIVLPYLEKNYLSKIFK